MPQFLVLVFFSWSSAAEGGVWLLQEDGASSMSTTVFLEELNSSPLFRFFTVCRAAVGVRTRVLAFTNAVTSPLVSEDPLLVLLCLIWCSSALDPHNVAFLPPIT